MSLKGFHIFFILLSILVTLGFAGWVFFLSGSSRVALSVAGIFSAAVAIILVPYGVWFVVKSRKIIV